jgi:hypothetical protein
MFLVMAMLRERLRPIAPIDPRDAAGGDGREPLWLRYADLVKLGFSPETSMIVAEAPVSLDTVTRLLVPDGRPQ